MKETIAKTRSKNTPEARLADKVAREEIRLTRDIAHQIPDKVSTLIALGLPLLPYKKRTTPKALAPKKQDLQPLTQTIKSTGPKLCLTQDKQGRIETRGRPRKDQRPIPLPPITPPPAGEISISNKSVAEAASALLLFNTVTFSFSAEKAYRPTALANPTSFESLSVGSEPEPATKMGVKFSSRKLYKL